MTDRAQRQAEAERAVRRGELKDALAMYRGLLVESPDDALRARIATIESLLQPDELSGRAAVAPPPVLNLGRPQTLEQTAEMLFERGDIPGALATYQRVLRERPDHDLARERIGELAALAPNTPAPADDLPHNRPAMFEALLARIAARRKG